MGANDHNIRVGLNIETQITNYENSLKSLQTELSKLRLPDGLKNQFVGIFTDAESEFKRLRQLTASGQLSPVNEKQVEASFARIDNLYQALIKKMKSNGMSTAMLEKDAKALETVGKSIAKYDKEISKTQKEYDNLTKKIETLTKAQEIRAEATKKGEEATKKEIDAEREALEAKKRSLELELEARKATFAADPEKGGGKDKTRGWTSTNQYKEKAAEIKEVEAQLDALKDKERQAQETSQEAAKQYEKDSEALKKLNVEAAATKQVLDKLKSDTLDAIKKDLSSSDVKWDSFGIKIEDIKSVEDLKTAYEKLKQTAGEETAREFAKITGLTEQSSAAFNELGKSVLNAIEEFSGLKGAQREVTRMTQNILRFFSIDNAVRLFKRAIRSAYNTIKDLDKVMTETAVVTEFSVGDMWSQLPEYTKRANELGVSIHSAYEAATIYYQQGLKTNEVMAVSNATLKMARIAGLEASEATDRMTNALRGFNMEITETNADRIADVYSKLAAITASNVDEISTAMTKTASLANSANMSFESTAAFLAQIIETTRESAETAGTALKTVIARFSEVKKLYSEGDLLGTDEEGQEIDVNKVSTALRTAGINLNEFLTGSKGLDEVFMELASKWDTLSITQQRYIATMAAGSRQQSRFIAMMSNYKRTQELVEAATNANGAAQQQYEKTLESLETKLARLKNAWDEFTMGLANSNFIKSVVDLLTNLLQAINNVTSGFGNTGSSILKVTAAFGAFILLKNVLPQLLAKLAGQFMATGDTLTKITEKSQNAEKNFAQLGKTYDETARGIMAAGTALSLVAGLVGKILKDAGFEEAGEKLQKISSIIGTVTAGFAALIPVLNALEVSIKASVLGWIALGIAAVAAIVSFIDWRSEAEEAADIAKESAEKARELNNTYKETETILDGIASFEEELDNLVVGTEEWTKKVQELNQQFLELIAKYPELSQFIKAGEGGKFYIADIEGFNKELAKRRDEALEASLTDVRDSLTSQQATLDETRRQKVSVHSVLGGIGLDSIGEENYDNVVDLVASALANGQILYTDETDYKKAVNDFLKTKGYENADLDWAYASIDILKEYGQSVNNFNLAIDSSSKTLLSLTRRLSTFELEEGMDAYYNAFFDSAERLKEVEGQSLEDIRKAAKKFADEIASDPYRKSIYDSGTSRGQIYGALGHQGLTEEEKALAQERIDRWNKLDEIVGKEYSNSLASGTLDYLLPIYNKLQKGEIALPTDFLDVLIQIPREVQEDFLNAFTGLNLGNISAIEEFPSILKELEIDTGDAEEAISNLVKELVALAKENENINFDNVRSLLEEFNGRKANERDWSLEQYKQWQALGVTQGWEKINDETMRYTGSLETMRQATQVSAKASGEGLDYNRYAGETDWRTLQDAQGGIEEAVARITSEAAAYEEAQDELEAYNKALKEGEDTQEALQKLQFATNIAKWNEKLKELRSTLDDDFEGLEKVDKGTNAYNDQLAKMATHLNEVFGLDLSGDFLQDAEAMDLLAQAMDGDMEAWEDFLLKMDQAQVQADASGQKFTEMGWKAEEAGNIVAALDGLDFDINGNANMDAVITALRDAGFTADQVARYLEDLSYTNVHFDVEAYEGRLDIKGSSATKIPVFSGYSSGSFGGGGGSSGGGGGSNKSWKNPFDELYNLTEKINEALRDREKLEREYDRILKDRFATAEELRNNSLEEIANLRKEIYLQQQLLAGRRSQLQQLGNELYETEGGYKSFAEMGVTKYGSYDENTGVITIDWAAIDKITDTEEGGAVEAYIKRLEELQGQIEDVQDTIEGMEDTIEEIKDRNKEGYLDFEQKVYNALVARDQKVIDEFSSLSDTIETVNNRVLDELQRSVDLERQIRDNTKTEEDIADKEARLAYLQRDTSGANALEIMQLQKDIEEARQSYEDTLIDQTISQLQDDNNRAAEQREREIELMQAQLNYNAENGAYWEKTYDLISKAYNPDGTLNNNSELVKLLGENDSFEGLSYFGKQNWVANMAQEWMAAQEGLSNWFVEDAENRGSVQLANGLSLTYDSKSKTWKDKEGNIYTDLAWDPQSRQYTAVQSLGVGTTTTTGSTSGTNKPSSGGGGTSGYNPSGTTERDPIVFNASGEGTTRLDRDYDSVSGQAHNYIPTGTEVMGPYEEAISGSKNKLVYVPKNDTYHEARTVDTFGNIISKRDERHSFINGMCQYCGQVAYDTFLNSSEYQQLLQNKKKQPGFATGGLADFTGLAWLDGSKSSPELVLNPRDTENFITLKNILAQSLERGMGAFGGDNYFDIDILVDELGSDYDVDKLAERLKKQIYEDSTYRNVNTLNFIR